MTAGERETLTTKENRMIEIIKKKIAALESANVSQDVINTWIGYLCSAIDRER
jgi:hypothetical protein